MKIFYQYSHLKALFPKSGDQINEMNTIEALGKFAQVHYGYCPMIPDVSIIRASKKAFREAKGRRLWMASPYDKEMFEKADLIFTFTDTWTKWLRDGKTFTLNPDGIAWGDKVVTFPQTLGSWFKPGKIKEGGPLTIGIFGRQTESTYSTAFMYHQDYFRKLFGVNLIEGYNNSKFKVPYGNVADKIRQCDIILIGQHGAEWEFCRNIKPLEAAACGVPVILERSEARENTFGKDYPGFVPKGTMESHRIGARNAVRDRIRYFLRGDNAKVQEILKRVAKRHSIEQTSKVLEGIMKGLL